MLKPSFSSSRDHYWGDLDAPVELLQYGGYQCRHSGDVWPVVTQLKEFFGNDLRFVFRHFPMPNLHHMSLEAAVVAEAAGQQGRFWEMHKKIMDNQFYLNRASLKIFADEIGLDMVEFNSSCKSRHLFRKITSDLESGIHSGVNGTPTFFINGLMYNGFDDFNNLYKICRFVADLCSIADERNYGWKHRCNVREQL
jgi:protein-disulfide isomerase